MKIVGCDLHARQQSIAILDTEIGEFAEKIIRHEGNAVREFYAALEKESRISKHSLPTLRPQHHAR
jgi:hypothetical protein